MTRRLAVLLLSLALTPAAARAACMNKFVAHTQGNRQVVTLLTGKLTYQEAYTLAQAIKAHQAPVLLWVDDKGKEIAKQVGEVKVERPMPVGCDGKPSGVVMVAEFFAVHPPTKAMSVKFDANTTVAFEEQKQ